MPGQLLMLFVHTLHILFYIVWNLFNLKSTIFIEVKIFRKNMWQEMNPRFLDLWGFWSGGVESALPVHRAHIDGVDTLCMLVQFIVSFSTFETITLAWANRTEFFRCIHFISLFSFVLNVYGLPRLAAGWTKSCHSWGVIAFVIYRPLLTLELRVNRMMRDVRITPSPGGLKYWSYWSPCLVEATPFNRPSANQKLHANN
jgi:hypothetical protein